MYQRTYMISLATATTKPKYYGLLYSILFTRIVNALGTGPLLQSQMRRRSSK